jgi:hypothetical protein
LDQGQGDGQGEDQGAQDHGGAVADA